MGQNGLNRLGIACSERAATTLMDTTNGTTDQVPTRATRVQQLRGNERQRRALTVSRLRTRDELVQSSTDFPSWIRGFDSRRSLHHEAAGQDTCPGLRLRRSRGLIQPAGNIRAIEGDARSTAQEAPYPLGRSTSAISRATASSSGAKSALMVSSTICSSVAK